MRSRLISTLCGTASLLVLGSTHPAAAQQAAQAAQPAGGSNNLEEIVVTARKREERVQTVPMAITAFTSADIEKQHITQVRDLEKAVPNFSSSYSSSDANAFYSGQVRIRGLAGAFLYFADVPVTDADYSNTTGLTKGLSKSFYFDLSDLEVVEGAQGTLFGRPSIGGFISIQPQHPTNDFEGYIRTTFGNYSDKENEFAVNIPIIEDKLLVRVAGQMQQRDGYTHDLQNGQDLDNINYYAWRIGVTFRPTDDFENYLLYDGYWQDSDGATDVLQTIVPGFTFAQIPLPVLGNVPLTLGNGPALSALTNPATAAATFGQLFAIKAAGGQPSLSFFPNLKSLFAQQQALGVRTILGRSSSGIGKDYFYGFTDVATWDVTDDLTIKNIAAARITKQLGVDDFTNSTLPILTIGWPSTDGVTPGNNHGWTDNSAQYTDELQIHGKSLHDKLDWQLGGFLMFTHPIGYNTEISDALGGPTYDHFYERDRSQAVFAHGVYDLSDYTQPLPDYLQNLRFTAGYRYTWDFDSLNEVSTKPVDFVQRNAAGIATNCNLISPHDNNCNYHVNSNFNSYGWNLGLDDQITPNLLAFIRAGNAYRPGGVNLAVPAPFNKFNPEHATDVEVGVKADYDYEGIKGRTNISAFHTSYKAIQVSEVITVPSAVPGQPPSAQQIQANAASAELAGGSIEQTLNLPFGLDVHGYASYIYTKYSSYPQVFGQTGAPGFQYVPKWQFAITPTYHLPINPDYGDISAQLTWFWYGHQAVTPLENEIIGNMPHYQDFDLELDWTNIMGYSYDFSFWVTNLTDNTHIVGEIPLTTSLGFTSGAYNPPRMFGFTLKMRFGPGLNTGLGI
jgi:iron complex outermembrane receptor protein